MARPAKTEPLSVCVDSDVLIAGLMSTKGASHAILVLGELGLFRLLVPKSRSGGSPAEPAGTASRRHPALRSVPLLPRRPACAQDRPRTKPPPRPHADTKDVPILAAAIGSGAALLVTHNIRHFTSTDSVRVLRPSALLEEARAWIATRGQ